jgi:IclR family acetate operon transcriptional repressor
LEEYRFVEKIEGRYRLGLAVLPLAHTYLLRNELAQVAFPVMQEAVQVSGEALTLFVRFGFHRILIQRVERDYPLRRTSALIGQPLPLHLGLGKVLAAAMPREEVLQMLSSLDGEVRFANGKRWTRSTFLAELNVIRRQGYCVSFSERIVGSCGLAAPILNKNGETIAAIGLVTSEEQMTSKIIRNLSVDLRSIAKTISDLYDGV